MKSKSAFTLVEVLITILLLTLLMSTAMFSFRFFTINLKSMKVTLPKNAIHYTYLEHSIKGIYFYPFQNNYFFKKSATSFTYITTTPLYYSHLSIAKVFYHNHTLIYQESPLYTQLQNFQNPKIIKKHYQVILKKNLSSCQFSFKLYSKTTIPKEVHILFNENEKNQEEWFFSIFSNNINYKSFIEYKGF